MQKAGFLMTWLILSTFLKHTCRHPDIFSILFSEVKQTHKYHNGVDVLSEVQEKDGDRLFTASSRRE